MYVCNTQMSESVISVLSDKEQTFIFPKPDVHMILQKEAKVKHMLINVDSRYRNRKDYANFTGSSASHYKIRMPFRTSKVLSMHMVSFESRYYMINIPEQVSFIVTYGPTLTEVGTIWPGNWSIAGLVATVNRVLRQGEIELKIDERSGEWTWERGANATFASTSIDTSTFGSYLSISGGTLHATNTRIRAGLPMPKFFPTYRYTFLQMKNIDLHRSADESVQFFAKIVWPAAIPSTCLNNFVASPVMFDPPRPIYELEVEFVDYLGKEASMDEHSYTLLVVYE